MEDPTHHEWGTGTVYTVLVGYVTTSTSYIRGMWGREVSKVSEVVHTIEGSEPHDPWI